MGRHVVDAALARGHDVTLFNRGIHNPELFPEARRLTGDRHGDLQPLREGRWDAVIDTSGYTPQTVRAAAAALADRARHYTFISTISVYEEAGDGQLNEDSDLLHLPDGASDEVGPETYGPLKAAAEQVAQEIFKDHCLVIRPGLIVGPHDPTDRFTYWPVRLDRGGEVLAPGVPDRTVQLIDVRDLARWLVDQVERQVTGVMNAAGPGSQLTMASFLERCRQAVEAEAELVWIDESFLLDAGVAPWTEIPLWLPKDMNAIMQVSIDRALASGLTFRDLEETARDTLSWHRGRPSSEILPTHGLNAARELALLEAWRAQREARQETN